MIGRYPVDGFFFNWFGFNEVDYSRAYHGPCHCSGCVRAFARFSGDTAELPTGPESATYGLWRTFVSESIDVLTTRIRDHIAQRRPDAGLILGQSADIVFHEANNAIGRELWPHATSEAVSAFRSHHPDVPVLVNSVAFVDMPYRMAGEQAEHFAQYLVQTISRGGNPSTYIMGTPGQIPCECLDVAGELTRFHARRHDVYDGMVPVARTGLVRPDRHGLDDDRHAEATAEFRGLYAALQERHIPFDVVAQQHIDEMAADGGLARYSLLVLGDLGPLAPSTVAELDAFVERGGRLLSTGATAITDDTVQLTNLPATRREAVHAGEERLFGVYVAADPATSEAPHRQVSTNGNGTADDVPAAYPAPVLPVHGAYHYLTWDDDATSQLTLLSQAPYGPPEKCYGHVPVGHPGYASGSFGQGRTVLIPWTIELPMIDLFEVIVVSDGTQR
ncbi:hypothetical protein [Phytoactinopolyspora endophytica]|uniref:hypothetical protein n=1 Tax=Phytoactinopolyspora endophytica TaxID=1642495 RepID=UPI00101B8EA0|nr:hypothetical protein [Phytoactinopolyspora endophytica]